jgi:hypothetical protein
MPKKTIITKSDILKTSIKILKEQGQERINARNIATSLGCSTQPIYSCFKNMQELKKALYIEIKNQYLLVVESYKNKTNMPMYKAYGMAFVKFAREEKELFKYLYLQDFDDDCPSNDDTSYNDAILEIKNSYKINDKNSKSLHDYMSIFSFGLAILQNKGANLTDEEISELFTNEFKALSSLFIVEEN